MAKFATPVAMKVTEEQGEYLLDKLISMGYKEDLTYRYDEGYITTNWIDSHCAVARVLYKPDRRHIIEEYNPELFLAIAAMTEDEIPIIGEWLNFKSINTLFRVNEYGKLNNHETGKINKVNPNGGGCFTKATLEELTNHFSKPKETFVLPKLWKLRVTEENVNAVNRWRTPLGKCLTLFPGYAVEQGGYWSQTINDIPTENIEITTEQFMEHVYNPSFNKEIPEEFYIHYCEGFTEDIFNQLYDWAKVHSSGIVRGYNDTYEHFSRNINKHWRFNFIKDPTINYGGHGYGVDNHDWGNEVNTKYTLEQVKKLINYKPKINKNECKEEEYSYRRESSYDSEKREIKQIDGDLDSISSRTGGKEIKIRTVSSRNLCERGSIESSNSITSPRGSSNRLRAERGRLYI